LDSFQVAQLQPKSGEDVVFAASTVEVEAVQVENLNSQGLLHGEVSWIVVEQIV
jgi:hypothetical protein